MSKELFGVHVNVHIHIGLFGVSAGLFLANSIERNLPPPGGFPIYYVPSSRTVWKRTSLEGFVPGSSRGVLLHTVLDEGT